MNQNLTEIVVVMDKSGSMQSCRQDAIGGLNQFIDEQKKLAGEANFTLIQFDDKYDVVHFGIPIASVPTCDLVPRGSTALFDAVGRAINETGQRLANKPENERPGLVVFVIITDGGENASKEFRSKRMIRDMIQHQTEKYNWRFLYLGSCQDGFQEGSSLGISSSYTYTQNNTNKAFMLASRLSSRMRTANSQGINIDSSMTQEEAQSLIN